MARCQTEHSALHRKLNQENVQRASQKPQSFPTSQVRQSKHQGGLSLRGSRKLPPTTCCANSFTILLGRLTLVAAKRRFWQCGRQEATILLQTQNASARNSGQARERSNTNNYRYNCNVNCHQIFSCHKDDSFLLETRILQIHCRKKLRIC